MTTATTAPTPQPEALRLASLLTAARSFDYARIGTDARFVEIRSAQALEIAQELARLHAENERLRAAERTLQHLGYQDRGGQQWVPPLGQAPDFGLIDSLRDRIAELVGDRLTAQKVEAICAREPYAVTGVVLSLPDGRACIVNQSAVRWFHGTGDFQALMHGDAAMETRKPLTEAEANALWAACLRKHKRPGPFELIQEFCAAGPLPGIAGGAS